VQAVVQAVVRVPVAEGEPVGAGKLIARGPGV
jgi:hypothetical protein